ncbi:MAG: hypothetical protein K0S37_3768 [Microbacterium sp.]|jgi:alpha-L-rhamnosidase|nr:hypothetical protein [Microbacterium sp.]
MGIGASIDTRVGKLRAEHREDSEFVAVARPRLSWIVETDIPDWRQQEVEIRLDGGEVAALSGPGHILIDWPFAALEPGARHRVDARVRGQVGDWSDWCASTAVRWGAVPGERWVAQFIGLPHPDRPAQPVQLRTTVAPRRRIQSAVLHLSALGAVRALIDGASVDDAVLSPGWTSYEQRVLYDTIDVTDHLGAGQHTLLLEVTGAWYTEQYGFGNGARRVYGEQPAAAAQLELRYDDGSTDSITTDETWEANGDWRIVSSGIYDGETIDLRRDEDSGTWTPARAFSAPRAVTPRTSEPVRQVDRLTPIDIVHAAGGDILVDFGQNIAGRLRLQVDGPRGTQISIRHAEVLDDGQLAVGPLRRAEAHDRVTLAGRGPEVVEPFGTFHGFRYATISGWPGSFDAGSVSAVVLSSDMPRTGWFASSSSLLNRLHENVVWSTRANFLSVPTDCPQRDERMGWTGDVEVFAPTARTLFDCSAFLANWLEDLAIEQKRWDGVVPFVVPDVLGFPPGPSAGWADAAAVVPAVLHARGADRAVLERQYSSMRDWVEVVAARADDAGLWRGDIQFGDWLDPSAPPDNPGAARADRDLVATAYWYRSTEIVAETAAILGLGSDVTKYSRLAERTRQAFLDAYVTPSGRIVSDAPTAYVLALVFGLVTDQAQRRTLGAHLRDRIRSDGYHIGTGFLGTPHVLDALVDTGQMEAAEALLLQTGNPSWLYPVTMGATTVWERWDSLLEDGSINPGEMTSFNHYAFGAVVDWLYRRLGGVSPLEPGYARIKFAPVLLGSLDHANVTIDSPSGRIVGGWQRRGNKVVLRLTVPAHAAALVELPGEAVREVGSGVHEWSIVSPAAPARSGAAADPITLFSPLRDIVDNASAFDAVLAAIEPYGPAARAFRRNTDWNASSPLIAALFALPPDAAGRIGQSLSAVVR